MKIYDNENYLSRYFKHMNKTFKNNFINDATDVIVGRKYNA